MNHSFNPSRLNNLECSICKRNEIDHTDRATCDICGNSGEMELFVNILMCVDCLEKERQGQKNLVATAEIRVDEAKQRIEEQKRIDREFETLAKKDQTIRISTDIFNAKIASINQLREAIDADESVKEKHFTLAKVLDERFKHLKDIIFSKRAEISKMENEQRAIQTYYNELAKKLRTEERDKIRLTDVTYQPKEPTQIKKPKAPTVKKYDKHEVRRVANQSGLPEQAIQMICIARNVTPIDAVRILQETGFSKKTGTE